MAIRPFAHTTLLLLLACPLLLTGNIVLADEVRLEGNYTLASNGDIALSLKLMPPMAIYQQLRDSVSNLYLVLRQFSSARADTEVVDKKADWDDSNRSMTFSLKMLGASRNLGNRWELDVPKGTEFINLDEAKRTLYFNESVPGGSEVTIRGTSRLVMPADAQNIKYDNSRRVITYSMPPVKAPSERNAVLLILAVILSVLGAALLVASFLIKPTAKT